MSGLLTVSLVANAILLFTLIIFLPTTTPIVAEPVCTCPIKDHEARSTAYTVRQFNHEPHAVDCPRRDMIKKE